MKIKITQTIEVPDGATHYQGDLMSAPICYKSESILGRIRWFHFDKQLGEWIDNKYPPSHLKHLLLENEHNNI